MKRTRPEKYVVRAALEDAYREALYDGISDGGGSEPASVSRGALIILDALDAAGFVITKAKP